MPATHFSQSSIRPLAAPAGQILVKLLDALPAGDLAAPGWRDKLVSAAEALLCAEAPEARLVASSVRQALLHEVLASVMPPRHTAATAQPLAAETPAPLPEGSLPGPAELAGAGFRGFTVRALPTATQAEAAAALRLLLGEKFTLTAFPSLAGYWTVELTGPEKPLVSDAWEVARQIQQTPPFNYAEPNLAVPAFPEPESAALESFGSPGDWDARNPNALANYEWSLDRCHIRALWPSSRGDGIVIGHIDTGYTLHPELKPNLDRVRDWDFWEGDADAQDPLEDGWWDKWRSKSPVLNPGHGTGTASVIVSPEGKQATTAGAPWVSGTAPAAILIPYRATPTVAILPFGSQDEVARAIVKAGDDGVDVISMSLGSPWDSQVLRDAVEHALNQGVIVCAAAGNIVQEWIQGSGVTFPARYDGVVAVAGCDYDYRAWRYSCRGAEVDITVGATDVWRAVATNDLNRAVVEPGSGTSFAVATVAGVAACWIGLHGGRAALRAHFGNNARLVPAAFLHCLRRHAKIPLLEGDAALFGGGVLDAQALANVPLPTVAELQGPAPAGLAAVGPGLAPVPAPPQVIFGAISPLDTAPAAVERTLQAWLGSSADRLDEMDLRQMAMHIATQPALLAHWRGSLAVGAGPHLQALGGEAAPDFKSVLALGVSAGLRQTLGVPGRTQDAARLSATRAAAAAETAALRGPLALPDLAPDPANAFRVPATPAPLKHVVAYFLHETEAAMAQQCMTRHGGAVESTRSFVMGQASDEDIAQMRAEKMLVRELRESAPPAARSFRAATAQAFAPGEAQRAHHFQMQLRGPLTTSRRQQLEQNYRIKVLEALGLDLFRIEATPTDATDIENIPFVLSVLAERVVTASHMQAFGPLMEMPSPVVAEPAAPVLDQPHDLWLKDHVDPAAFIARLEQSGYQVVGSGGQKVRVQVVPGSAEARTLNTMSEVGAMEPFIPPTLCISHARRLIGLAQAGTPPRDFPWTGDGELIAIADTGIDRNHPDLTRQIQTVVALGRPGVDNDPHGHGTHVAGAAVGDGSASGQAMVGAAPGAKLYFQSILAPPKFSEPYPLALPVALSQLFDPPYQAGARIHNDSWGFLANAFYRLSSFEVDDYVYKHPDLLVVISAGNDGATASPAPPGRRLSAMGSVDWYSLRAPATSKNALTVGASQSDITSGGWAAATYHQIMPAQFPLASVPGDVAALKISGAPEELACFSSRGPTSTFQVKPDVVAPGTDIVSARSALAPVGSFSGIFAGNPQYAHMCGTSMAAPIVSGCAALVREYYAKARHYRQPSAALIKATIINGTRPLTGTQAVALAGGFPNGHQGFGRIDMRNTIPDPAAPEFELFYCDTWQGTDGTQPLAMEDRQRFEFTIPPQAQVGWLRICLTHTDPPGSGLQNSLILELHNETANVKWWGNENQQTSLAQQMPAPDRVNNVLIVRVENPPPGHYYLGVLVASIVSGPQHFALVITAPALPAVIVRPFNN